MHTFIYFTIIKKPCTEMEITICSIAQSTKKCTNLVNYMYSCLKKRLINLVTVMCKLRIMTGN